MIFRQFIDDDLGCASYLLGDAGEAAVIDPSWDTERYLSFAEAQGLRITRVFETHMHADHVSGHGRLAAASGAEILVSAEAGAAFAHTPLRPGDSFGFGAVTVDVVGTPGHRPEHLAFLITDKTRYTEPTVLLSGDSLLVGDVARPDLAAADSDEVDAAARTLYASIHRLTGLPDYVELWPGHIGGSLCVGAGTSEKPSSTLALERRANTALETNDEDAFIADLRARLPERPPSVDRVVELNRGKLIADPSPLSALEPAAVDQLLRAGASIVDGRSAEAFDASSITGSLCLPLQRPGVGTKAAWLLDPEAPLVLVADDAARAAQLASRLAAVGLFDTRGYLTADIGAWRAEGLPINVVRRVTAGQAAELLARDAAVLLDVRDPDEHAQIAVLNSLHVPWRELPRRAAEIRDLGKPIVVGCASGRRTATAASLVASVSGPPVLRLANEGIASLQRYGIPLRSRENSS
jgi:glyoxylase-like metal-dependent hydrolase (beta-lactamase superfamily II)/rhodanese-related sulfurtransferase